jgi:hypothetical protein
VPVHVPTTDTERHELYRVLDIRRKLANGQAYAEPRRVSSKPPRGNFPPGVRSRMVNIKLTVNDWLLCRAHQYVNADGSGYTGPDQKWIRVDDVIFKEGRLP